MRGYCGERIGEPLKDEAKGSSQKEDKRSNAHVISLAHLTQVVGASDMA
jgi:hypothetical protein